MELEASNIFLAFVLTLLAGLSTGIGGLVALKKHINKKMLAFALGLSTGVMVYVSLIELLPESFDAMVEGFGIHGPWVALVGFFGGMLLIALIDKVLPEQQGPHDLACVDVASGERPFIPKVKDEEHASKSKILRAGSLTAIAISIHNFPEGIASFFGTLHDPTIGLGIAIAIAIHNIPEGICVAVPIKYATDNNKRAIGIAALSGLAEPLGALIGFLLLSPFINQTVMGVIFAVVAGIMVFISIDELFPAAVKTNEHHLTIGGIVIGMAIMASSMQMLNYF